MSQCSVDDDELLLYGRATAQFLHVCVELGKFQLCLEEVEVNAMRTSRMTNMRTTTRIRLTLMTCNGDGAPPVGWHRQTDQSDREIWDWAGEDDR